MVVTYGRCCYPIPWRRDFWLPQRRPGTGHPPGRVRQPCGIQEATGEMGPGRVGRRARQNIHGRDPGGGKKQAGCPGGRRRQHISATETNIEHVDVVERDGDTSSLTFLLQVRDGPHLQRVLKSIKSMPDVLDVVRTST